LTEKHILHKNETLIRIENLRDKLHLLINEFGIDSNEVLKCSIELDELIFCLKKEQEKDKESSKNTD